MIDALIFDLDGTLWDTSKTCAIAWNNITRKNSISFRDITKEDIEKVMGLTHEQCIEKTFTGLPQKDIDLIIHETIAEDSKMVRDLGGDLYPGVPEVLFELWQKYPLYIVSNCQQGYIESFLEFTDFGPYFKDFECWGNTERKKSENIKSIIERNGLNNPVYIGDTESDKTAASEAGLDFIYANYGFGTCEDVSRTISSFEDLPNLLAGQNQPTPLSEQSINTTHS